MRGPTEAYFANDTVQQLPNSATYPQWKGSGLPSVGWVQCEGLVWLIGAVACLLFAPQVELYLHFLAMKANI